MPEPEVRRRAPRLLEQVGLADRSREPIARFSKGMIQRLGLAQAMLNEPDLLVMDEPTEGLDLEGRRVVHDLVAGQRSRGRSVLLVSHALADVENLCDRVGVLVQGRLVHLGPLSGLNRDPATGAVRSLADVLRNLYEKTPP
jgi:ABC-2 type transport system ATP-binding protein